MAIFIVKQLAQAKLDFIQEQIKQAHLTSDNDFCEFLQEEKIALITTFRHLDKLLQDEVSAEAKRQNKS